MSMLPYRACRLQFTSLSCRNHAVIGEVDKLVPKCYEKYLKRGNCIKRKQQRVNNTYFRLWEENVGKMQFFLTVLYSCIFCKSPYKVMYCMTNCVLVLSIFHSTNVKCLYSIQRYLWEQHNNIKVVIVRSNSEEWSNDIKNFAESWLWIIQ